MPPTGARTGAAASSSAVALPTAIIAGKWRVTRFLGAGSFGHVFAGQDIHDASASPVALKRAIFQSDKPTNQPSVGIDYLAAELAGLRQITAAGAAPESLPKLFSNELIETPRGLIMVMSCHGPALATVKKALMVARMGGNEWGVSEMTASDKVVPGMGLDVEVVVDIGRQLGETLDWIHKQGLVYCDMKLANVVLRHPNPPSTSPVFPADIVLIDHGLIRPIRPPRQQSSATSSSSSTPNEPPRNDRIGTPRYASISMHRGHPPTPSSDAESLAYTLLDLTLSHLPWTKVDAKPGPATWQAISRAKSHMTEHEWSQLLGEPDADAPSARWANMLIHLWDAARLARPRNTGRFPWGQVFPGGGERRAPLWKGVPKSVLDIVEKELTHAHDAAEREAGFRSPSASQLDSWGMPVLDKEAKVVLVSDPWGGAAAAGDVPPPNAAASAPSSVASRGGGASAGWADAAAAAWGPAATRSSSHGSSGWAGPAGKECQDGSDGWGAAADEWPAPRTSGGRSSRPGSAGGRTGSGSDRGRYRAGAPSRPHALQQEVLTQQQEEQEARAACAWEQPASPAWDHGRATGGDSWGGKGSGSGRSGAGEQQARSSPTGAGRRGDQRGAVGESWDRSSGRGAGGSRQGGGGNGSRRESTRQSQDVRRAGGGGGSDGRGQRAGGSGGEWRTSGGGGWSGSSSRPQALASRSGGGGGHDQDQQGEDDGWGGSSGQQNSRRGGSGRGARNTGVGNSRGWQ